MLTLNIVRICTGTRVSHRVHVAHIAIHICVYTTRYTLIRAVVYVTHVYYSELQTPLRENKGYLNWILIYARSKYNDLSIDTLDTYCIQRKISSVSSVILYFSSKHHILNSFTALS